ncbi:MAG: GYD domain-containing protein [Limisphaerales bacterium]
MATFLMLGKYSQEGIKESPVRRKEHVESLVEECGGTLDAMYPLQEENDYAFVVTFSETEEAVNAEEVLGRTMGISFA